MGTISGVQGVVREARAVLLIGALSLGVARGGVAQMSPEEHASHHLDQAESREAAAPGGDTPGGMGGMMGGGGKSKGGMGGMMKNMGAPPPIELYPSLIALPDLPMEKRAEIKAQAHTRMKEGAALLSTSLERLSMAAPGDDFRAMKGALDGMREGLTRLDSGVSAHLALAEGSAPRNVALQWFKKEMNLLPPAPGPGESKLLGLSPFHFFSMLLLIVFATTMIWMYFHKMRRAQELLQALAARGAKPSAPVVAAPPVAQAVAVATPAATAIKTEVQTPAKTPASAPVRVAGGKWSGKLKVVRAFQETHDTKTFRMMNGEGGAIPFTYLPGQFLTLAVEQDGKKIKRSYTISSSPTVQDYVEITVKREQHGLVSRYLHDTLKEGEALEIKAPGGRLTFTGEGQDSIVLIGGGVGITPMMSVIRYLTDRSWRGSIYFLFSCKTTKDFVFREELEYLQRRNSNLNVMATMTREEGTVWMGLKGRLTAALIKTAVGDMEKPTVHICGPPPMMDAIKGMLDELGVPGDHVYTEAFGPAKKAKPKAPGKASPAAQPKKGQAPKKADAPGPASSTATVTFAASDKSGPLGADDTVLDVAEALDIDIDNSCRSGSCGACTVKLLEGDVTMEVEDGLDADQKAEGLILACQAKSKSKLVIDA